MAGPEKGSNEHLRLKVGAHAPPSLPPAITILSLVLSCTYLQMAPTPDQDAGQTLTDLVLQHRVQGTSSSPLQGVYYIPDYVSQVGTGVRGKTREGTEPAARRTEGAHAVCCALQSFPIPILMLTTKPTSQEEEQRLLNHVYASKIETKLSGRRLQNHGGVVHPKGAFCMRGVAACSMPSQPASGLAMQSGTGKKKLWGAAGCVDIRTHSDSPPACRAAAGPAALLATIHHGAHAQGHWGVWAAAPQPRACQRVSNEGQGHANGLAVGMHGCCEWPAACTSWWMHRLQQHRCVHLPSPAPPVRPHARAGWWWEMRVQVPPWGGHPPPRGRPGLLPRRVHPLPGGPCSHPLPTEGAA